jgi:hypothetical protein
MPLMAEETRTSCASRPPGPPLGQASGPTVMRASAPSGTTWISPWEKPSSSNRSQLRMCDLRPRAQRRPRGRARLQQRTVARYSGSNSLGEMAKTFWIFVHVDLEHPAQAALLPFDRQAQVGDWPVLHCPGDSHDQAPLLGLPPTA